MLPWQNWTSSQCDPVGIVGNKQVKGQMLAKRINGHSGHVNYSKSHNGFLKYVKGNDPKRREQKSKVPGFD